MRFKLDFLILTKTEREAVAQCYDFYCIRRDIGWRPTGKYEKAASVLCARGWFYEDGTMRYTYHLTTPGHDAYWKYLVRSR